MATKTFKPVLPLHNSSPPYTSISWFWAKMPFSLLPEEFYCRFCSQCITLKPKPKSPSRHRKLRRQRSTEEPEVIDLKPRDSILVILSKYTQDPQVLCHNLNQTEPLLLLHSLFSSTDQTSNDFAMYVSVDDGRLPCMAAFDRVVLMRLLMLNGTAQLPGWKMKKKQVLPSVRPCGLTWRNTTFNTASPKWISGCNNIH